ncbi:DUF5709 domain-containing protein [Streptomyces sp. NBC_00268]|uniref:DUF5709 domain-containing protein n=1 Tax=Streptomyces sp. NBC_00268 TaxID=2975695 RepID=UPI0022568EA9|nr:DUF5709 domain-containing protein [Streptomyces sp. NBC_00268]MCX5181674.1 DUF5709 domain-containing protein [Streptomyces sp. NBC_00268]
MAYEAMGDEVYQPDGSEVQDDAGLLDVSDTLDDRGVDEALDEGYSPPERPWGVEHTGVTAAERQRGESLDERLAEEIPDVAVQVGDGIGDLWDGDGELIDDEVGDRRAGRLIGPDEGAHEDTEKDLIAYDAGVDGAGASAEEAAMHVIPDSESF